jgi:hypothetical protein
MSEYGKLFRKRENGLTFFTLKSYDPDKEKYFELIRNAREENFRQVIINSKIMTDILFSTINSGGIILKVNMSDNTDQDVTDNIKSLIRRLREDKIFFVKLKEQLDWAAESGSIDINSIEIYNYNKKYQLYSNGIIYGQNLSHFFEKNILKVLEEYFNG